jgi:hypothetical protein
MREVSTGSGNMGKEAVVAYFKMYPNKPNEEIEKNFETSVP